MKKSILEAKSVSFAYKPGKPVLSGVSLSVRSGERVGLTAPSGAGKTTLCRIVSGYLRPQAGEALLDGEGVFSLKGYCPVQMIWQHPEKSVNPRARMKEAIAEGDAVEERVIDGLGIERAWYDRFPGELSGGEIQRFCIARALGRRTKILIADEITTMLDLITQSQIWNFLLEEIDRRGLGLLAVTHSDPLMAKVAARVMELESPEGGFRESDGDDP